MYVASDRIFKALLLYVRNEHKTDTKHAGLMVWGDKTFGQTPFSSLPGQAYGLTELIQA